MIRFAFVSSWRRLGAALIFPVSWGLLASCASNDEGSRSEPVADGADADVSDHRSGTDSGSDAEGELESGVLPATDQFGDVSRWRRFDPAATSEAPFMSAGAASDGRYVYAASGRYGPFYYNTKLLRHDPAKGFDNADAWSTFDPASLSIDMIAASVVVDGHFVYFIPGTTQFNTPSRVVLRYDTSVDGPFDAPSAWSSMEVTSVPSWTQFSGALVANGFLYLVPNPRSTLGRPVLGRYDTSKDFADIASWETLSLDQISPAINYMSSFSGAVFDGRYITFVPGGDASFVARYDTTLPLEEPASWQTFDTMALSLHARSFSGAVFDGKYLYFAPNSSATTFGTSNYFLRFDTTGDLADIDSWTMMTVSQVSTFKSYSAGTFDGQYVYFAPGPDNAIALRVDTRGTFSDPASWQRFALTSLDTAARSYSGAVFDGTSVYFTPNHLVVGSSITGPLLRFQPMVDAGSP